jgi:hypothetical protein
MKAGFVAAGVLLLAVSPLLRAEGGITAVYSRTSDDYVRATAPDGSPQAETYAFGNGGYMPAPIHDNTIDNLGFIDIAHTLAGPLATQNFLPARDPNRTGLLIMVYWGATSTPYDFGAAHFATGGSDFLDFSPSGAEIDMARQGNAGILGYSGELEKYQSPWGTRLADINDELDSSRYFVVLMAYDFKAMWKDKKHRLLWEARFSVREQGNDFTRALPAMAQYASTYFGRDSHGLLRTRVPDGRIDMGDPTVIEFLTGSPAMRN